MNTQQVESLALLMIISVTYSFSLARIERLRLAVTAGKVPAVHGAWLLAGALLLPPLPLLALTVVIYVAEWPSRRVVASRHPWRYVYSCASGAVATLTSSWVATAIPGWPGVFASLATFCLLSAGLIMAAIVAARQYSVLKMFCSVSSQLVEIGTAASGAVLATGMHLHPAAALAAGPCLALLHASALREVVRSTRAYDPDTGLWSEDAWRVQAQQLLVDSGRDYVALIIIDPEQAGQEAAIVAGLGSGVRRQEGKTSGDNDARDLVGRYGTRQVAVLMAVGPASAGRLFMQRISGNLLTAGITATLGVAVTADQELGELIMDSVSDLMSRREMTGVNQQW